VLEKERADLREVLEKAQHKVAELKKIKKEQEEEIERLKKQICPPGSCRPAGDDEHASQMALLTEKLKSLMDQIADLEAEMKRLLAIIAQRDQTILDLEAQLRRLKEELAEKDRMLAELNAQLAQLNAQLAQQGGDAEKDRIIAELNRTIVQRDGTITEDQRIIAALRAELDAKNKMLQDLQNQLEAALARPTGGSTDKYLFEHFKTHPFEIERFFAKHEFSAPHLLCCSDCEAFGLQQLLTIADSDIKALYDNLSLGYTESQGLPKLRQEIAGMYCGGIAAEGVLIGSPQELILLGISASVSPGDHVIAMWPAYQSLHEVVIAAGGELSRLDVTAPGFDLYSWVEGLLRPNTTCLVLNLPHNPTGYLPAKCEFIRVLQLAHTRGVRVFSDEMYRHLEADCCDLLPAVCDEVPTGVSLCGLSKSFGLPGLRLGWLASSDLDFISRAAALKDWTSICTAAPSEALGLVAVRAREQLWQRNREIIHHNLGLADTFFKKYAEIFDYSPPKAGPICYPTLKVKWEGGVFDFCETLVKEAGVLLLPARVYGSDTNNFRLGLGRRDFGSSLEHFGVWLDARFGKKVYDNVYDPNKCGFVDADDSMGPLTPKTASRRAASTEQHVRSDSPEIFQSTEFHRYQHNNPNATVDNLTPRSLAAAQALSPKTEAINTLKAEMASEFATLQNQTENAANLAAFDINGDGKIDASEAVLMNAMQQATPTSTTVQKQREEAATLAAFDINGDGKIDASEAVLMNAVKQATPKSTVTTAPQPVAPQDHGAQTIHHTASEDNVSIFREFRKFDADGDGYISNQEFHAVMGGKMPPGKVNAVFNMINTNGNGKISLDEFKKVYHLLVSVPTPTSSPAPVVREAYVAVQANASQANQGGAGVYGQSGANLVQGSNVARTFHHASTAQSVDDLLRSQWDPDESRRWENARGVGDALEGLSPNTRGVRRMERRMF